MENIILSVVTNDLGLALKYSKVIQNLTKEHLSNFTGSCDWNWTKYEKRGFYDLTTRGIYNKPTGIENCVIVLETRDVSVPEITRNQVDFSLSISRSSIGLDINPKSGHEKKIGKQTLIKKLLKYNASSGVPNVDTSALKKKRDLQSMISSYWLDNKSIEPDTIFGMLIDSGLVSTTHLTPDMRRRHSRYKMSNKKKEELLEWLKKTYNSRLKEKGYVTTSTLEEIILDSTGASSELLLNSEGNDDEDDIGDELFDMICSGEVNIQQYIDEIGPSDMEDGVDISEYISFDNMVDDFADIDKALFDFQNNESYKLTAANLCIRNSYFWDKVIHYQEQDLLMKTSLLNSTKYQGTNTFLLAMDELRSTSELIKQSIEIQPVFMEYDENMEVDEE